MMQAVTHRKMGRNHRCVRTISISPFVVLLCLHMIGLLQQYMFCTSQEVVHEVPNHKAMPPLMDPVPTLPEITHRIYMDIDIDSQPAGTILIGLFGKNAPEAAENFRLLSTTTGGGAGRRSYQGTSFHRIVPHFAIQGGDITHGTGVGGIAAIGSGYWPRMHNVTKFNRPYLLAVATPNHRAARSQFFITTVKAQWLTGQYTIFGMILEGTDVIGQMERQGTYGGRPLVPVVIRDCGEQPLQPEDLEPHYQ